MPSVQRIRWARFRVVATTLVALLILATLVYLLTGGTIFATRSVLYVYVPDGTGIEQGTPVRVDGIQVGKVESVSLSGSGEPNRVVRVRMSVDAGRLPSITVDSTAQPTSDTMVGDKVIQITSGRSNRHVRAGGEIPYKGSPDLVKTLDLSQFRQSLTQMDALLTEIEKGRNEFGQFIMTDTMYRDLLSRIGDLERALRAASSTTGAIGHELYTAELYRRISDPILRVDAMLARLQLGQGTGGQLLRDTQQYEQARSQIEAVRKQIAAIRDSPFLATDTAYNEWNRNLAGWIRQVDDFNRSPALQSSATYDNLAGMARELQQTVNDFRRDPRKYLRMKFF
ncbi:MAG: MCE family protein [Acidobacteria bacterium]|nr:MCE family protein [Acidobacteriota bacterium]